METPDRVYSCISSRQNCISNFIFPNYFVPKGYDYLKSTDFSLFLTYSIIIILKNIPVNYIFNNSRSNCVMEKSKMDINLCGATN